MKKITIFFTLFFYTLPLFSRELSIDLFRQQQRILVLKEFKTLYRSRNYQSHKADLVLKYKRVKKLHNPSILNNHTFSMQDSNIDELHIEHSNLQIKSNHDLSTVNHYSAEGDTGDNISDCIESEIVDTLQSNTEDTDILSNTQESVDEQEQAEDENIIEITTDAEHQAIKKIGDKTTTQIPRSLYSNPWKRK